MKTAKPVPEEYLATKNRLTLFLTDRQLRVLSLLYGDSDTQLRTDKEVGEILGMPRQTVFKIRHWALAALRYFTSPAFDEEDERAVAELGIDETWVGRHINMSRSRTGTSMARILGVDLEHHVITLEAPRVPVGKIRPRSLLLHRWPHELQ